MQITWLPAALCTDEAMDTLEGAQWRKSPGDFGIGGRYPVKEVFAAAAATWQGESPLTSSRTPLASSHSGVQLTLRGEPCVFLHGVDFLRLTKRMAHNSEL